MLDWIQEHTEPDMRFEYLMRTLFDNCGKADDPFGFASADRYNQFCQEAPNEVSMVGKAMLIVAITKMSEKIADQGDLESLSNSVHKITSLISQEEAIEEIDHLIEICLKNNIN